jgi:uncharacterized coiled-coil DUF342 family protein
MPKSKNIDDLIEQFISHQLKIDRYYSVLGSLRDELWTRPIEKRLLEKINKHVAKREKIADEFRNS